MLTFDCCSANFFHGQRVCCQIHILIFKCVLRIFLQSTSAALPSLKCMSSEYIMKLKHDLNMESPIRPGTATGPLLSTIHQAVRLAAVIRNSNNPRMASSLVFFIRVH